MIYKLSSKILGVKNTSLFSEFNLDYEVKDICFVPEKGFYFTANQCLGNIGLDGKLLFPFAGKENVSVANNGYLRRLTFQNPCGICYNKECRTIMVVECSGKRIRSLNINDEYYSSYQFSNIFDKQMDDILQDKFDNGKTYISANNKYVVWGNSLSNYVFEVYDSSSLSVYGNRKSGFACSNTKKNNQMRNPSGACYINNCLYISDKNNNCIRFFDKSGYGFIGKPCNGEIFPEKIISIGDYFYFVDGKKLKSFLVTKKEFVTLDDGIVSICKGDKDKLYVLIGE